MRPFQCRPTWAGCRPGEQPCNGRQPCQPRDLRVAEVVKQHLHLGEDGEITYRTKLRLSFSRAVSHGLQGVICGLGADGSHPAYALPARLAGHAAPQGSRSSGLYP